MLEGVTDYSVFLRLTECVRFADVAEILVAAHNKEISTEKFFRKFLNHSFWDLKSSGRALKFLLFDCVGRIIQENTEKVGAYPKEFLRIGHC